MHIRRRVLVSVSSASLYIKRFTYTNHKSIYDITLNVPNREHVSLTGPAPYIQFAILMGWVTLIIYSIIIESCVYIVCIQENT